MICPACGHSTDDHGLYGCTEGADAELAALREKAALFDALAAAVTRKNGRDWAIYHGIGTPVVVYLRGSGEIVHAATLAEAVTKAMEAEGLR